MSRSNSPHGLNTAAPQNFSNFFSNFKTNDSGKQSTTELTKIEAKNNYATFEIEQASLGKNPAFDLIGLTELRNDPQFAGIDGSGFSVAVIDTGIDLTHPLIEPNYIGGYDFVDLDETPLDQNGHGTHVSGIIGAADENIGVATDAGLISLQVLDSNGSGSLKNIEDALEWVLVHQEEYNITAVNLSLGDGFFTSESELGESSQAKAFYRLQEDIQNLEAAGVTVVAASGNNYLVHQDQSNRENIAFPAISSTIAVGAVWQDGRESSTFWQDGTTDFSTGADRIPSFSQRLDTENMIFAPGAIITSTLPDNRIGENAGTSQAAPHIAGTVALLQEASWQFSGDVLTPAEINEILRTTGDVIFDGDDEDDNVENTNAAYIRVNVYRAVAEVKRRSQELAPPSITNNDLDGTISQANKITTLPIANLRGEIGRDGAREVSDRDVDFYHLNLGTSGILEIEVNSLSIDPLNSVIVLFDAAGQRLAVNDEYQDNDSRLKFQVSSATDYYLGVTGSGNQNFTPFAIGSGTGGDTGKYTLDAEISPLSERDNLVDNQITSPAVQTINLDTTLFGNVGHDSGLVIGNTDIDLYRFVSATNETITVETITSEEFGVDTYLRLFDESGQEIAANNDVSQTNRGSLLQFEAIADKQYYIGVNGNSEAGRAYNPLTGGETAAGSVGNYYLRLSGNKDSATELTSDHDHAIYQFFHGDLRANFYTASIQERDFIIDNLNQYSIGAESFTSATEENSIDPLIDAKPVYRFFNTSTGGHLYTVSLTERNFIQNNLTNYRAEGIAYHAYETEQSGTIPLYRLYNPQTDVHLFTSSLVNKDEALASIPGYQLEANNGVAFYVKV